jgi:hypothetical protein
MLKLSPTLLTSLLAVVTAVQIAPPAGSATVPTEQSSNIFVLGGAPLPISVEALAGDRNVLDKEQQYLASIGIYIDKSDAKPRSKTIDCRDRQGCAHPDSDAGF